MKFLLTLTVLLAALLSQGQGKKTTALKGLDPILLIEGKQVQGKEEIAAEDARFRYLFSSADTKKTFESDPARYGIQLNGKCVMSDGMEGATNLFAVAGGRIYVGGSEMCIGSFKASPGEFVNLSTGARQPARPQNAQTAPDTRKKVAILIFPGVQIIDYAGPFEVFGQGRMNPYTVAENASEITTAMGMKVTPSYTFANCPKPDIIVIPGGNVQPDNAAVIAWIQEQAKTSEYVLSVCNGAFYLAKAGLLDGKSATTFYGLIDALKTAAPSCKVVSDKRFVDNGKVITTAGLSSGIDGALHVIERVHGFGVAQAAALNMEYDWQPEGKYARASLADAPLRRMLGGQGFAIPTEKTKSWIVVGQKGDQTWWQKDWIAELDLSPAELAKFLDAKMSESWTRISGDANGSDWKFKDDEGKDWTAKATVKELSPKKYSLSIALRKA